MSRETKTFKTPTGKEFVLNTYITVPERRRIRGVYFSGDKTEFDMGSQEVKGKMTAEMLDKSEDIFLEIMVVSYDQSSENILERLYQSTQDFDYINQKANELVNANLPKAK